jgi:hypothetical protein
MAQRVVFHIGLMKSGTTFIQGRLDTNRGRLAEQGILFPGPTWARHVRAVSDLRLGKNRKPGSWASLTEEIDEHPGTAIVSMEYLAPMGAARIAVLRRSFPDTEIRVAVTVRDLGRTVPAMWQEALKNRRTCSGRTTSRRSSPAEIPEGASGCSSTRAGSCAGGRRPSAPRRCTS